MKKMVILFFALMMMSSGAFASGFFEVTLPDHRIVSGKTFELKIRFYKEPALSNYQIRKITSPRHENFELINSSQSSSQGVLNQEIYPMVEFIYSFKAKKDGAFHLSPLALEFEKDGEIQLEQSDRIELNVSSPFQDWGYRLLYFLIALSVLMGSFFLFRFLSSLYREKKENLLKRETIEKVHSYEEQLQSEYLELKKTLFNGDLQGYLKKSHQLLLKEKNNLSKIETTEVIAKQNQCEDLIRLFEKMIESVCYAGNSLSKIDQDRIVKKCDQFFTKS